MATAPAAPAAPVTANTTPGAQPGGGFVYAGQVAAAANRAAAATPTNNPGAGQNSAGVNANSVTTSWNGPSNAAGSAPLNPNQYSTPGNAAPAQGGLVPAGMPSANWSAGQLAAYVKANGTTNLQSQSWWANNPNKDAAWALIQGGTATGSAGTPGATGNTPSGTTPTNDVLNPGLVTPTNPNGYDTATATGVVNNPNSTDAQRYAAQSFITDQQTNDMLTAISSRVDTLNTENATAIKNIQDSFNILKQQQNIANQMEIGGNTVAGEVTGRSRYAPEVQNSIISGVMNRGIQRLAQLDVQENTAVAEANAANDSKQFDLLTTKLNTVRQAQLDKQAELKTMQDHAMALAQFSLDQNKFTLEQQQANATKVFDELNTFGSQAYTGVSDDTLHATEAAAGLPYGFLTSRAQTLAEIEKNRMVLSPGSTLIQATPTGATQTFNVPAQGQYIPQVRDAAGNIIQSAGVYYPNGQTGQGGPQFVAMGANGQPITPTPSSTPSGSTSYQSQTWPAAASTWTGNSDGYGQSNSIFSNLPQGIPQSQYTPEQLSTLKADITKAENVNPAYNNPGGINTSQPNNLQGLRTAYNDPKLTVETVQDSKGTHYLLHFGTPEAGQNAMDKVLGIGGATTGGTTGTPAVGSLSAADQADAIQKGYKDPAAWAFYSALKNSFGGNTDQIPIYQPLTDVEVRNATSVDKSLTAVQDMMKLLGTNDDPSQGNTTKNIFTKELLTPGSQYNTDLGTIQAFLPHIFDGSRVGLKDPLKALVPTFNGLLYSGTGIRSKLQNLQDALTTFKDLFAKGRTSDILSTQ